MLRKQDDDSQTPLASMPMVAAELVVVCVTDARLGVAHPTRWRPLETRCDNPARCSSSGVLVLDKPPRTTLDPGTVVSAIVPAVFELDVPMRSGTYRMQVQCLRWSVAVLERFHRTLSDPQVLLGTTQNEIDCPTTVQQERRDSRHVSEWFVRTTREQLRRPAGSTSVSLLDMLVPVVNRVAFASGGDFRTLIDNIRDHAGMLETETLYKHIYIKTFYDEIEFVNAVMSYERHTLPKILRVVVASCLQRAPCNYATLPVATAFALAVLRHVWCNMKVDMYTRMEVAMVRWQ